jgi:hypothetical protein
MICRSLVLAAMVAALLAFPANIRAQTRTVVVPAEADVVVPPRGAAIPRPAQATVARRRPLPPMLPAETDWSGSPSAAGVLLPAIAAAALTAVLANGGSSATSGVSGPVRTR